MLVLFIKSTIFKLFRIEESPKLKQFLMIVFYTIRYGLLKILTFGCIRFFHFIVQLFLAKEIIKAHPANIKQPIYLRKNSSDIIIFFQNIFKQEIAFAYSTAPTLFIDIGANIGTQSVLMKKFYPEIKIIAVEISELNNQILRRNLENYSAIHIENKPIHFKNCPIKTGRLDNVKNSFWNYTAIESDQHDEHTVNSITVNDLIKKYQLKKIDVLKIDIEPDHFQYTLLTQNNTWLEITDHVFIDLNFNEQMKTIKHGLQAPIKELAKKFNFQYTINGEFLHLYKKD